DAPVFSALAQFRKIRKAKPMHALAELRVNQTAKVRSAAPWRLVHGHWLDAVGNHARRRLGRCEDALGIGLALVVRGVKLQRDLVADARAAGIRVDAQAWLRTRRRRLPDLRRPAPGR